MKQSPTRDEFLSPNKHFSTTSTKTTCGKKQRGESNYFSVKPDIKVICKNTKKKKKKKSYCFWKYVYEDLLYF